MSGFMRSEAPYSVTAADGSKVWLGAAWVNTAFEFRSLEASAAFVVGEAVRASFAAGANPTNAALLYSFMPRWNFAATDTIYGGQLGGLRIAGATDQGFLGVVLGGVPAGQMGLACGPGSFAVVVCTATAIALGASVGGSATAGSAAANSTATQILGNTINANLAFATPSTDTPRTGSTTQVGLVVAPR